MVKSLARERLYPSSRNRRDVESKPKWLRKEFTRLFVNNFWNKYNSYFSKGFCPILGLQILQATKCSDTIYSGSVPTFIQHKVVSPVFTMLVPGSLASIHSLDVISRNK